MNKKTIGIARNNSHEEVRTFYLTFAVFFIFSLMHRHILIHPIMGLFRQSKYPTLFSRSPLSI